MCGLEKEPRGYLLNLQAVITCSFVIMWFPVAHHLLPAPGTASDCSIDWQLDTGRRKELINLIFVSNFRRPFVSPRKVTRFNA